MINWNKIWKTFKGFAMDNFASQKNFKYYMVYGGANEENAILGLCAPIFSREEQAIIAVFCILWSGNKYELVTIKVGGYKGMG